VNGPHRWRPVNTDRRQSVSIELILPPEMRLPVVTDFVTLLADFVHPFDPGMASP
jgi:hypothetical protein